MAGRSIPSPRVRRGVRDVEAAAFNRLDVRSHFLLCLWTAVS
ncbi:hypothetical protein GCM10009682_29910 [Luedemannella flava]|uniref:Uncharacterized protein n=1 Tax=Luedemannella flava TaxID=349316 RepID=A0ABP4Y7C8_9ACTN